MHTACRRLLILAALAGVAVLLCLRSPLQPGNYPPCPSYFLTGFHCPGCGSLRGLHALLQGDIRQALAYNSLALIVLPPLIGCILWGLAADLRGRPRRPLPVWVVRLVLIAIAAYWVLRNMPAAPFDQLAPHRLSANEEDR
jgi:hypothetical protein